MEIVMLLFAATGIIVSIYAKFAHESKRGAFRLEVESDNPIVRTERVAERTAEIAGRAGYEDDRPAVAVCHPQMRH
jgi:hypothetical protein